MKKQKQPSSLSRLMEYAGGYKILTYLSWILSFISALTALLPLVYIFFIIREVLEVAPDFSKATSIVHNGVMAVVFSAVALLIYFGALMFSSNITGTLLFFNSKDQKIGVKTGNNHFTIPNCRKSALFALLSHKRCAGQTMKKRKQRNGRSLARSITAPRTEKSAITKINIK